MTAPSGDDERLRELLADARAVDPMPADVAARLDEVLGDLRRDTVADRDEPEPAPVVPLRRRAARGLVAAAAVLVLGGVAVSEIAGGGAGGGADSAVSGAADDASGGARKESSEGRADRTGKGDRPSDGLRSSTADDFDHFDRSESKAFAAQSGAAPVRLRSAHFAQDVRRFLDSGALDRRNRLSQLSAKAPRATDGSTGARRCAVPEGVPAARVEPVLMDGRAASLVISGSGRDQVATAYSCDGEDVLAHAPLR